MAKSPSPPEFIKVWQSAASAAEVASRLQMRKGTVHTRAFRYRKRGVRLKTFPPTEVADWNWAALAAYAQKVEEAERPEDIPIPVAGKRVVPRPARRPRPKRYCAECARALRIGRRIRGCEQCVWDEPERPDGVPPDRT